MAKEVFYRRRKKRETLTLLSRDLKKRLKKIYDNKIKFSVRVVFDTRYTGINVLFDENLIPDETLDDIYLFLKNFAEKKSPLLIIINEVKYFDSNVPSEFVKWRLYSLDSVSKYVKNIENVVNVIRKDKSIDGTDGIGRNKRELKRHENPSCDLKDCPYNLEDFFIDKIKKDIDENTNLPFSMRETLMYIYYQEEGEKYWKIFFDKYIEEMLNVD